MSLSFPKTFCLSRDGVQIQGVKSISTTLGIDPFHVILEYDDGTIHTVNGDDYIIDPIKRTFTIPTRDGKSYTIHELK